MVVSALQQKILKRNSQKYKPNLTLIVNPNYRPGKSGKIQNNISKPTIFKSKFFRKRKTGLITLFFLLSISATLLLFCFPIFSLNRELAEFSFSDTGGSIIDFLPSDLTLTGLKQQAKPNAAALSNLKTSFYKVKNGDSLSGIAKKYELDVGTVISFNKISNSRSLKKGIQLEIPNHNGLRYVVKKGDSLNDLSKRYNISLDKLLDWNNLESSIIRKGQVLFLPGAKLSRSEINAVLGRLFIYPTVGSLSSGFG